MNAIMSFFQTEGTCFFDFKETWTDREINSTEADSETGFCMRNGAPMGSEETDRKREIEQEKGAREQLHVHLQLLVLLV